MDKRNELITELILLLKSVKECEINNLDGNLFGSQYDFTPGEMLDVCMKLRMKYSIKLNSLLQNIENYTVNNIADALSDVVLSYD